MKRYYNMNGMRRQTACMVNNYIMADNFASPLNIDDGESVLKLTDGSTLNLIQKVGA